MRVVVTGSSGHLGEGLARTLRRRGDDVVGIDLREGEETTVVASIGDRRAVKTALDGAEAVVHTATLHKPHIATHTRSDFVETNIAGTLNLLEEAVAARVGRFVFTSTNEHLRPCARPGRRCAGRVDHRASHTRAAQHLRRHQAGRRKPVRAVSSARGAAVHRASHLALLPPTKTTAARFARPSRTRM